MLNAMNHPCLQKLLFIFLRTMQGIYQLVDGFLGIQNRPELKSFQREIFQLHRVPLYRHLRPWAHPRLRKEWGNIQINHFRDGVQIYIFQNHQKVSESRLIHRIIKGHLRSGTNTIFFSWKCGRIRLFFGEGIFSMKFCAFSMQFEN